MCVKQRQIMCDVSAVAAIVSASFAPLARRSCQTFRGRTDTLRYALNKAARVLLLAAGAANTACTLPTPRENFDSQVAALIGKSSETQRYALRGELLVMETKLGNGNISRNYKYLGDCLIYVEIDPSKKVIVDAHGAGRVEDCIFPP